MELHDEFVHDEKHKLEVKAGKPIASALSGFIAGVVFASIIWLTGVIIFKAYLGFVGVQ